MDAARSLHQSHRSGLPFRRLLCAFQTGRTSALCFTLRLRSAWPPLSFISTRRLAPIEISIWRSPISGTRRSFSFLRSFFIFVWFTRSGSNSLKRRRWRAGLLYVPAVLLLLLASFVFLRGVLTPVLPAPAQCSRPSLKSFVGVLLQAEFLSTSWPGLVASVFFLVRTWIRAKSAVVRQQMKWVIWGSVLAVAPFTLLYADRVSCWALKPTPG